MINGYWLRTELAKILPNYSWDTDNDGQIIIYSNLVEIDDDNYEEME